MGLPALSFSAWYALFANAAGRVRYSMTESLIQLGPWRIWCDADCTRNIYARIASGGPEKCGCAGCRQFVKMRDIFYPPEMKDLLANFGIDFRKEAEIVTYADPGQPPLEGWYHFVGRMENGEEDLWMLGDFQLDLSNGGTLLQPEFGSLSVVKLEWRWPIKGCAGNSLILG